MYLGGHHLVVSGAGSHRTPIFPTPNQQAKVIFYQVISGIRKKGALATYWPFLKGWRPKTPFSVFEPILYRYICTITTGFYIRNTLYYEGSYGDFLPACCLLPQEGMEKHCFFFTIVIQAFRSLLLLPLLLLPTAAATTSCHCTG